MELIERMDPFDNRNDLMFPEHYARYMFASQFTKEKIVLDCSCGNGYGAFYIAANGAKRVRGVDISADAIAFSQKHFKRENLTFMEGNALELTEVEDQSIEVFTCFETIEHIEDTNNLLKEVKRVLKPDGVFIISCPNDHIFNPNNPFHVDVYDLNKFSSLLEKFFNSSELYVQNNTNGSSIFSPKHIENANEMSEGQVSISYPVNSKEAAFADTWLFVCADVEVSTKVSPVSSFFPSYSQFVIEMQDEIRNLYEENQKIAKGWEKQNEYIRGFEKEYAKLQEQFDDLNVYVKKVEVENKKLAEAWEKHSEYIKNLEKENKKLAIEEAKLSNAWQEHTNYINILEIENRKLAQAWQDHDSYIKKLESQIMSENASEWKDK